MIIDAHCHVIVPEMTARSVPEAWRPALRTEDGQRIVGFRGQELTSAVGEFSDVEIMLGDFGVAHLPDASGQATATASAAPAAKSSREFLSQ